MNKMQSFCGTAASASKLSAQPSVHIFGLPMMINGRPLDGFPSSAESLGHLQGGLEELLNNLLRQTSATPGSHRTVVAGAEQAQVPFEELAAKVNTARWKAQIESTRSFAGLNKEFADELIAWINELDSRIEELKKSEVSISSEQELKDALNAGGFLPQHLRLLNELFYLRETVELEDDSTLPKISAIRYSIQNTARNIVKAVFSDELDINLSVEAAVLRIENQACSFFAPFCSVKYTYEGAYSSAVHVYGDSCFKETKELAIEREMLNFLTTGKFPISELVSPSTLRNCKVTYKSSAPAAFLVKAFNERKNIREIFGNFYKQRILLQRLCDFLLKLENLLHSGSVATGSIEYDLALQIFQQALQQNADSFQYLPQTTRFAEYHFFRATLKEILAQLIQRYSHAAGEFLVNQQADIEKIFQLAEARSNNFESYKVLSDGFYEYLKTQWNALKDVLPMMMNAKSANQSGIIVWLTCIFTLAEYLNSTENLFCRDGLFGAAITDGLYEPIRAAYARTCQTPSPAAASAGPANAVVNDNGVGASADARLAASPAQSTAVATASTVILRTNPQDYFQPEFWEILINGKPKTKPVAEAHAEEASLTSQLTTFFNAAQQQLALLSAPASQAELVAAVPAPEPAPAVENVYVDDERHVPLNPAERVVDCLVWAAFKAASFWRPAPAAEQPAEADAQALPGNGAGGR